MPEEEKKTVDIDTSGPEVDIDIDSALLERKLPTTQHSLHRLPLALVLKL